MEGSILNIIFIFRNGGYHVPDNNWGDIVLNMGINVVIISIIINQLFSVIREVIKVHISVMRNILIFWPVLPQNVFFVGSGTSDGVDPSFHQINLGINDGRSLTKHSSRFFISSMIDMLSHQQSRGIVGVHIGNIVSSITRKTSVYDRLHRQFSIGTRIINWGLRVSSSVLFCLRGFDGQCRLDSRVF